MANSKPDGINGAMSTPPAIKVTAQQLTRLKEANAKYKNLLKMAKERIEKQEEDITRLRAESQRIRERGDGEDKRTLLVTDDNMEIGDGAESSCTIARIWQRIKVELEAHELNAKGGNEEIWALVEFEMGDPDQPFASPPKRTKKWKRFDSETELADFIRRETGEPLALPPYSFTPQQSSKIEEEAKKTISRITEDFRRFRVKSEMARKQADAQIRDLQNNNVESAKRLIASQEPFTDKDSDVARTENSKLERMRSDMARQEAQWKESYDLLLAENSALKSSGSEAMLASQWRQRYEACRREKEEIRYQLRMERKKSETADTGKYEMKYRDLKESFRLYRQKAKELFEAQQAGQANAPIIQISEKSNEDSKLSYLKNLMLNYFTSDLAVREHMEGAIGTVLGFSKEDIEKIDQKKNESGYWGLF